MITPTLAEIYRQARTRPGVLYQTGAGQFIVAGNSTRPGLEDGELLRLFQTDAGAWQLDRLEQNELIAVFATKGAAKDYLFERSR